MIKKLYRGAAQLFDLTYTVRFVLKLFAFFLLFNFLNYLWIGLTVPGGLYSPFLAKYMDYITFIKISCLNTGVFIADLFGVHSYVSGGNTVKVLGSGSLLMLRSCIGLELLSFWAAFIVADSTHPLKKIIWGVSGLVCIWFINCLRVALLITALKKRWQILYMDHHTLFNICAYTLIFLLIFIYYRKNRKQLGDVKPAGIV